MSISTRTNEDNACCFRTLRSGGVRVIWEIVSKCNLDCIHCFVDHTENGISTDEAWRVISEFKKIPVAKVMFTGGEPFLRKDLLDLVAGSIAQGSIVDITTNLTLMSDAHIARLKEIGIHEITTSLDGPEAVHDFIRKKPGNFRQVTTTIAKLRAAGIDVDLVCVAQRANASCVGEVIRIASQLEVSSITISGFKHQGPASLQAAQVDLLPGQYDSLVGQISTARAELGSRLPIRTVSLVNQFLEPCACPMTNILGINAKGLVSNCLLAPTPVSEMADVRAGLRRAWEQVSREYCCSQSVWSPSLREHHRPISI